MAQTTGAGLLAAADAGAEPLDVVCARLNGTVRGLKSALAEAEESRDSASARLLLAEQDLAMLAGRARMLERELAEAREQIELEALHSRALAQKLEGSLPAAVAARLGGEIAGLRARCDDARARRRVSSRALGPARIGELERRLRAKARMAAKRRPSSVA